MQLSEVFRRLLEYADTIVLDSLSISQSTQGLDGEFWRQELAEEGDYLSGTCCGKDFAQRVEAESEQRARAATMVFDRNGMQARHGDASFDGERHGEGEQREQGAEFVGVGQVRGLQREALGLETVSYTHLRAHETRHDLVCRLL